MNPRSPTQRRLVAAERFLENNAVRFGLSALIILSVIPPPELARFLPAPVVAWLEPALLVIFGLELGVRVGIYLRRWRERRAGRWELALLILDTIAVATFLPGVDELIAGRFLRFARLARLVLLYRHWGGIVRDLWEVLTRPERRYQVLTVVLLGLVLAFAAAVLLLNLEARHDYDGDGVIDDGGPLQMFWWSFRQVQDPGNLVARPDDPLLVVLSLLLTFAGLLLFSFFVGIGTGAVEEVFRRARARPVGLAGHTVILGLPPFGSILLEGLADIYRKNLGRFRGALLGAAEEAPEVLAEAPLRAVRYRSGQPERVADLDKVDVAAAKRVLILGTRPEDGDAEVIAAILAARDRNPTVDLYPDVEHEKSFPAMRAAGGAHTHLVGSGPFLGFYVVQNLVFPGSHRIFRQLLQSRGCEIYTYLYPEDERRRLVALHGGEGIDLRDLWERGWRDEGTNLIGVFVVDPERGGPEGLEHDGEEGPVENGVEDIDETADVVLNPVVASRDPSHRRASAFDGAGRVRPEALRGLVAVGLRWENVRGLARSLLRRRPGPTERSATPPADPVGIDPFASLRLDPPRPPARRVLICGESPRVPRVVHELVAWFGDVSLEVTILVRDPAQREELLWGVANRLGVAPESRRESADGDPNRAPVVLELAGGGRVRFLGLDWTDLRRLLERPDLELDAVDALLFLPGTGRGEELDGSVALDCLHLAELEARGELVLDPQLRVLGMVRDPVKGRHLERRLETVHGPRSTPRYAVISSERARHDFIVQNVFVRGLNQVYLRLLDASGQSLARLLPGTRDDFAGSFDPWELAVHLLEHEGRVLVGLELAREPGDGGPVGDAGDPDHEPCRVELDPRALAPGSRIPWRRLMGLYCLGAQGELFRPPGRDDGDDASRP